VGRIAAVVASRWHAGGSTLVAVCGAIFPASVGWGASPFPPQQEPRSHALSMSPPAADWRRKIFVRFHFLHFRREYGGFSSQDRLRMRSGCGQDWVRMRSGLGQGSIRTNSGCPQDYVFRIIAPRRRPKGRNTDYRSCSCWLSIIILCLYMAVAARRGCRFGRRLARCPDVFWSDMAARTPAVRAVLACRHAPPRTIPPAGAWVLVLT
jgi:hypothetical protein